MISEFSRICTNFYGFQKLIKQYAEQDGKSNILDLDVTMSPRAFAELVWGAYSDENYFKVWTWLNGVLNLKDSPELGKFYVKCKSILCSLGQCCS